MPTSASSSPVSTTDFRRELALKKPPKFIFSYKGNYSPSTREPKFYDTHMHDKLLLKRVEVIPSLPEFFTRCALNTIEARSDAKKASVLHKILRECEPWDCTSISIANEKDLQDAIKVRVGNLPMNVASILLFDAPKQFILDDPPAAAFSVTGAKGKLDLYCSIADAACATPDLKLVQKMINMRGMSPMAWELKGLTAGNLDTMAAVVAQEGSYNWIHCTKSSGDCSKSHHWTRYNTMSVSGAPTGPDAELHTEILAKSQSFSSLSSNSFPQRAKNSRSPIKNMRENQLEKGRWVCQQVWAGAVASDTTLVVIRSGAWEIYGIRIRKTQTLLLSPVIDVQRQPEYLLLQAGLVIFAYNDAVKRAKALLKYGEDPFQSLKYDYPDMALRRSDRPEVKGAEEIHVDIQAKFDNGISKITLAGSTDAYFPSESSEMNFTREPEFTEYGEANFTGPPQAVLQLLEDRSGQSENICEGVLTVLDHQYKVVVKMARADAGVGYLEDEYASIVSSVNHHRSGGD